MTFPVSYASNTYPTILPLEKKLASTTLQRLFLLPGSLLLSLSALTGAEQACHVSQQLTYNIVHEQAVSIKTYLLSNTTFFPIQDVGVTISNPPKSFDGVTTFRWTQTRTIRAQQRCLAQHQRRKLHQLQQTRGLSCTSWGRGNTARDSLDLIGWTPTESLPT